MEDVSRRTAGTQSRPAIAYKRRKDIVVPEGLTVLTSYGFWIRLLGIFTFLSSAVGEIASGPGTVPLEAE